MTPPGRHHHRRLKLAAGSAATLSSSSNSSGGGNGSSGSEGSSSSVERMKRRLLQTRQINGKGNSMCYSDDELTPAAGRLRTESTGADKANETSTASAAAAAAANFDPSQDSNTKSSSSSTSGGRRRQLLSRTEAEKEPDYCRYYAKYTTFTQPVYDCVVDSTQRVGVFVSAWVGNTAGYLRQVRLQSNVEPGSDPSMYVGTLYISQTQPWKQQDPWLLPKNGLRKNRRRL
jgi:hypothetical protein